MKIHLKLSESIVKSFRQLNADPLCAALVGTNEYDNNNNNIAIHSVVFFETNNFDTLKRLVESSIPAGFKIVGFWKSKHDNSSLEKFLSSLKDDDYLIWRSAVEEILSKDILPNQFDMNLLESTDDDDLDFKISWITVEELKQKTITLKLDYCLPLALQLVDDCSEKEIEKEVQRAFDALLSKFSPKYNNEDQIYHSFKTKLGNVLLSDSDNCIFPDGISGSSSCLDLWRFLQTDDRLGKRKDLCFSQDSINFKVLRQITDDKMAATHYNFVPVVYYEMQLFTSVTIPIKINAVCVCSQTTKLNEITTLLTSALERQILNAKHCVLNQSNFKTGKFALPESFLFLPSEFSHFIQLYYPKGRTNDELEDIRRQICKLWSLPQDRPTIRRENKFQFSDQLVSYLRNVHENVGSSGIQGTLAVVKGYYQYHHYMQDNFNDNGWGCAYRSFQTIWSWFLLQGYTEKPVPSHREIQQALVDIGDRPATFVGTKQWIGSMELSFCLNHMLGFDSKILTVNSGAEMLTICRELITHFEIDGSPIMIGGGVLAHTILGVQFCEESGQAKFLILDPHYTGEDNIKTIVDKGWCGWKPISFWDDTSFYNMLLPMKPKMF